jgi:hypothetical protein
MHVAACSVECGSPASAFAPLLGKRSLTKPLDQYPKSYSANICNVNYRRGGAKRTRGHDGGARGKDTGSAYSSEC